MFKIEKNYLRTLSSYKPGKSDQKELAGFSRAAKEFEKLVEAGLVIKRGNQQLSVEDAHLKQFEVLNKP